ncbi:aldehyde dehydrogenase family protein [Patulibacter defluvii]|uniref:aldehyde dehydrogenase family protein n=1 Tax=Patulibacter defluvii TaxID=3095358 RepID=UPI002A75C5A0|nr:aldehyde dehydrogenase family protein [Patulibacter sp. DM4]
MSTTTATLERQALIDGRWTDGAAGTMEVRSPYDGRLVGTTTRCDAADVDRAVAAAVAAQKAWARTSLVERVELFERAMTIAEERNEAIAQLITAEMGKTIREAREEMVQYATPHFRRAAQDALRHHGTTRPSTEEPTNRKRIMTTRRPLGVIGVIGPYNFPVDIPMIPVLYGIIAGNAVVWKPSEKAPLCCAMVVDVLLEAGLPAGVLSFVPGAGDVGAALVEHPDVAGIQFTGSTDVGKRIARAAELKRTLLELGGNGPQIVFADADLDAAVEAATMGCFYMAGQVCTAAERILVHRDRYDEFVERLAAKAAELRMGDPAEEATDMGPLVDDATLAKVRRHVEDARRAGATVIQPEAPGGLFYPPTVLRDVTPEMEIAREETFGPVAPVIPFETLEEAIAIANDSPYALNAAAFTADLDTAWAICDALDHGTVLINETTNYWDQMAPFGGAKQSGIGRELGGIQMLDTVTEPKTLVFNVGRG